LALSQSFLTDRRRILIRLQNKAAIVTGAAGGIGSAVAKRLAEEGAAVCLADMRSSDSVAAEIRERGGNAITASCDVTSKSSVVAMVENALAAFQKVDILVNVAGVSSHGSAETVSEAEWDRVLACNLKGVFLCCQAVIAPMRARRYGRIINIGSILGKNGGNPRPWLDRKEQVRAGNLAYGASKAGVHSMSLFLAKELACDNITVNVVAPGPIASAMTTNFPETLRALIPMGRMGQAKDVAEAVAFLAGDGAEFITGEILDVNGGMMVD
jgi:3-oxoacyl-[acyl-carrier protein] reductase